MSKNSNEWVDYIIANGVPNPGVAKFWQDIIDYSISQESIIVISEFIKAQYYNTTDLNYVKNNRILNNKQVIDTITNLIIDLKLESQEFNFILDNLAIYFNEQKTEFSVNLKNFCSRIYNHFSKNISENERLIQQIKENVTKLTLYWQSKEFNEEFYQKIDNLRELVFKEGVITTNDILIPSMVILNDFFDNPTEFSFQNILNVDVPDIEHRLKIIKLIKDIKAVTITDNNADFTSFSFVEFANDDPNDRLVFYVGNESLMPLNSAEAMTLAKIIYVQNKQSSQIEQTIYNIAEKIMIFSINEKKNVIPVVQFSKLQEIEKNSAYGLKKSQIGKKSEDNGKGKEKVDDEYEKPQNKDKNKEDEFVEIGKNVSYVNRILFSDEIFEEDMKKAIQNSRQTKEDEEDKNKDQLSEGSSSSGVENRQFDNNRSEYSEYDLEKALMESMNTYESEKTKKALEETDRGSSSFNNSMQKDDINQEKLNKQSGTDDNTKSEHDTDKIKADESVSYKRKRDRDEETGEKNEENRLAKKQKLPSINTDNNYLIQRFEEKLDKQEFNNIESFCKILKKITNLRDDTFAENKIIFTKLYDEIYEILLGNDIILFNKVFKSFVEEYLIGWYISKFSENDNFHDFELEFIGAEVTSIEDIF